MNFNSSDGIIEPDSPRGAAFGYTSDKYAGYLWKTGDSIVVSFIESLSKGNFRELVSRIHAAGFTVKVPTPLPRMLEILRKNNYQHTVVHDPELDEDIEVWVLPPPPP